MKVVDKRNNNSIWYWIAGGATIVLVAVFGRFFKNETTGEKETALDKLKAFFKK